MRIKGDLNQISDQLYALRCEHIAYIGHFPYYEVYDDRAALECFWDRMTPGWWNYINELVDYGICSKEEAMKDLEYDIERRKRREDEGKT